MKIVKKFRSGKAFYNTLAERIHCLNHIQPKVGLLSARGMGNFGDDIMMDATQKLMSDYKIMDFSRWEQILKNLGLSGEPYFKYVVLGGGTLIHNANKARIKIVKQALEEGFSIYSLGTGVGCPCFGNAPNIAINEWKPLLSNFTKIGVRGPRSRKSLESIGIDNVQVIGDLALSFTVKQATNLSKSLKFAVNVRLPQPNQDRQKSSEMELQFQEVKAATLNLIKQGWQPIPIAMHFSDVEPLRDLMRSVSMEELEIPVVSTVDDFFEIVSSCSFTIGVRLHSVVLSCCAGIPPLMLGYRDKCLDFMQSMDLEEWYLDFYTVKPNEIAEKAILLAEKSPELSPIVLDKAQFWKSKIEDYVAEILADIQITQ